MEGMNEAALGGNDADGLGEESNSDEEDAQLARLLESASDMAGKKQGKRAREDESEEEEAVFYDDFFGSGTRPGGHPPPTLRLPNHLSVYSPLWKGYEFHHPEENPFPGSGHSGWLPLFVCV